MAQNLRPAQMLQKVANTIKAFTKANAESQDPQVKAFLAEMGTLALDLIECNSHSQALRWVAKHGPKLLAAPAYQPTAILAAPDEQYAIRTLIIRTVETLLRHLAAENMSPPAATTV